MLVLLVTGLVLAALRYRRSRHPANAVIVIVLALALLAVGGALAASAYEQYVQDNTWSFGYSVNIDGNGTEPGSLIAPIPTDESLLAGLHISSGSANWSFVDTPKGRGLFVHFTGSVSLQASVSRFPRSTTFPDTSPTLRTSSNCTAVWSNCTGLPMFWMFYSGPSGVLIGLTLSPWQVSGYSQAGWATYVAMPPPMPMA